MRTGPSKANQEQVLRNNEEGLRNDEEIILTQHEIRKEMHVIAEEDRRLIKEQLEQFEAEIIAKVQPIDVREDILRGYSAARMQEYENLAIEYRNIKKQLKESLEKLNLSLEAQLAYAWSLHTLGKLRDAEVAYRSIVEGYPDNSAARRGLGMILTDLARYEDAVEVFTEVLAKDRGALGEDHPTVLKDLSNLAMLYLNTGRIDESESLMNEALENLKGQQDPASVDMAILLSNYGSILEKRTRIAEAKEACERAIAIGERVGPDEPLTGLFYHNLSRLYQQEGSHELAQEFQVKAMSIWEEKLPEHHYWMAAGLNGMGALALEYGDYAEANLYFEKSLACIKHVFEGDHPWLAAIHRKFANILKETGNLDAAKKEAELALQIDVRIFGSDHLCIVPDLNELGEVLRARKETHAAERCYRRAIEIHRVAGQPFPSELASLKSNLGLALSEMDSVSEAEVLLREALEMDKSFYGENHWKTVVRLYNLAAFLQDKIHNTEEAVRLYEQAIRIADEGISKRKHPDVGRILNNLGAIYIEEPKTREKGMRQIERALAIFEESLGAWHPTTVRVRGNLKACRGKYSGQSRRLRIVN